MVVANSMHYFTVHDDENIFYLNIFESINIYFNFKYSSKIVNLILITCILVYCAYSNCIEHLFYTCSRHRPIQI